MPELPTKVKTTMQIPKLNHLRAPKLLVPMLLAVKLLSEEMNRQVSRKSYKKASSSA